MRRASARRGPTDRARAASFRGDGGATFSAKSGPNMVMDPATITDRDRVVSSIERLHRWCTCDQGWIATMVRCFVEATPRTNGSPQLAIRRAPTPSGHDDC
jgi:hypothetical protein